MADKKIGKMANRVGLGRVGSSPTDEKDMARIREILFGDHIRETNNRMARIESLLSAQDTALRELLEMRIARSAKELHEELGNRDRRQTTALDALDAELRARLEESDKRLMLLDSDLQDARNKTDRSLDDHASSLQQLREDCVDRAQLAELFEGLARQFRKTSDK